VTDHEPQPNDAGRRSAAAAFAALVAVIALALIAAIGTGALGLGGAGQASQPPTGQAPFPPPDPVPWQDIQWVRLEDQAGVLGGPLGQRIDRIVAGGPGFVAIGATSEGQPGAETSRGTIWLSDTGERWARHVLRGGVAPGDDASLYQVAAGPKGIVVMGNICCSSEQAAAWWSEDGSAWERVQLPQGAAPPPGVYDVAAGPDGFVAVGISGQSMAIWTSPDGRDWTAVDEKAAGLVRGSFGSVVRDDRGWLAIGVRDDRRTHEGAVWRSPDLASWRAISDAPPLAGPEEIELGTVHRFAGGYLLVGNLGTHEERVRCEQLLGHAEGRLALSSDLALSCGWGVTTHWWSADGEGWQLLPPVAQAAGAPPLPLGPGGRGLIYRWPIRPGGPGLVTIGYEAVDPEAAGDVRAVWVTPDGRTWIPVGAAPQFPPEASVADMVVVGRQIIAVGSTWSPEAAAQPGAGTGEDGAIWIGTVLP
jgi:hypothetical protein